jgi:hypothetical protein
MPRCHVCKDLDPAELEFGEQIGMSALKEQIQTCRGCHLLYQALASFRPTEDPEEEIFLEEQTWPGKEQTLTYRLGSDGASNNEVCGEVEFYTLSGKISASKSLTHCGS